MEGRDSYERTDNYNVYGLFCFFAVQMRRSFFKWVQQPISDEFNVPSAFNSPMQHAYTFELLQPLLVICMRSKSETVRALAFEKTHMLAYLLRYHKKQFATLCVY